MALSVDFIANGADVLMRIKAPEDGPKKPNNIVICYDRSGSMMNAANPNGDETMKLFSKNDLCKHLVQIIACSLKPDDTLEIITYDDTVHNLFPRTAMNKSGQAAAIAAITTVTPGGGTALYDGLIASMKAAEKTTKELGDTTVFMLTDGEPSYSPSEGEVAALKTYRIQNENQCRLHTVGVGYDIKSKLLHDLANVGDHGGSFIFIPDGSLMITSGVHALAYEKAIFAKDIKIGNTNLGTIAYGQTKNMIISHSDLRAFKSLGYHEVASGNHATVDISTPLFGDDTALFKKEAAVHEVLASVNDILKFAQININESQSIAKAVMMKVMIDLGDHPITDDMLGQVSEGIASNQAFHKWGGHYLRALISAHKNNKSHNFKDPGPMAYDSAVLKAMRNDIDVFVKSVDTPKPSIVNYAGGYGGYSQTASAPIVSRQQFDNSFYNASGGCFGGDSLVEMQDGTTKKIKDVRKGDELRSSSWLNKGATVACVIVYKNADTLVLPGGAQITPWHPIYVQGAWMFPKDAFPDAPVRNEDDVFNFILDSYHMIMLRGPDTQSGSTVACTLGHGMEGHVIGHKFYGTRRVINDLKNFPGYNEGRVVISQSNYVYDTTNTVTALRNANTCC